MEIRFLHADHLRLAGSIRGLAEGPAWLKSLAAGAFRQATRNIINEAIATKARFLVIAGSVTDSDADLHTVVCWLDGQFESLRRAGVAVVAWANDSRHHAALSRICDVVLHPDQTLDVMTDSPAVAGGLRFRACSPSGVSLDSQGVVLNISVGRTLPSVPHPDPVLRYMIQPSRQHLHASRLVAGNGRLTASAGAAQATGPDEQHACGCLLVKADAQTHSLSAEFVETDVLQFRQKNISVAADSSSTDLRVSIARALRELDVNNGRTLLVDGIVHDVNPQHFMEANLLQNLRSELQAGHRGIWPRTLQYADSSASFTSCPMSPAMREFVSIVASEGDMVSGRLAEARTGLELLARAA